jgi:ferric-dicitrate binding protein FerR (iron transport regulator)
MNKEEYIKWYEKSIEGKLSTEERELLENYTDEFNLEAHQWDEKLMGDKNKVKKEIFQQILNGIEAKDSRVLSWKIWLAAASIIFVMLTSGIYFYTQNQIDATTIISKTESNIEVLLGNNQATLTLSDGSKIALNDTKNEVIKKEANAEIKKISTSLIYSRSVDKIPSNLYNTVSTPNGGQYHIQLEDGTKVWLNAASSIHFPVAFSGVERVVELKGEAYFEVAKNAKMPFKVYLNSGKTDKLMQIEVLGTHFNVSAYSNEDFKTTLLEGSVRLTNNSKKSLILQPGEQSVLNNFGKMEVKPANLKEAIAWKNRLFIFDHENIEGIMKKLSRWYNIEVEYVGELANKEFVATISRDENLSEVLKLLELTGTVQFEVKGKKVIVR